MRAGAKVVHLDGDGLDGAPAEFPGATRRVTGPAVGPNLNGGDADHRPQVDRPPLEHKTS